MKTVIARAEGAALTWAKEYILNGEVVAFHTETVYGLGADARSDNAVKRIFQLKGRPADNPLIVHVHKDYDIASLVDYVPPYAEALKREYLPGPLTMVFPSKGKVSALVSCGLQTLAVRVPSSVTAQAFLKEADIPIAAPSANLSKHVSPVTARHVYDDFAGKIPLILDGGECSGGIESTVLDCTGEVPQILRAGLVTQEMIARVAGDCGVYRMKSGEKPKSPGMAYQYYSPRCATAYYPQEELAAAVERYQREEQAGNRPCFLCESELACGALSAFCTLDLGHTGKEMARRLYALLRRGEEISGILIAIEPKEKGGVMEGVLNRLTRACRGNGNEA